MATPAPEPLRRELLVSFAVLFAAAVLLAVFAVLALGPALTSPRRTTVFVATLIALDLAVLFAFGSALLRRRLVDPVERLVGDVRRMTEGGAHRVGPMPAAELQVIGESVNALADRLEHDRALLAENVSSLDRTNAELVEARGQVVQAARLASVGSLAAGIAHEIGNPLGAILGYVDVARARAARDGRDPALLEAVRAEALRIDRIIKSLLDYARPRSGEVGVVAPAEVLGRVLELLAAQGKLEGVDVVLSAVERVPCVRAEPSRLEQVLVNLILNALHAMTDAPARRLELRIGDEPGPMSRMPRRRESDPRGVDYLHRRRLRGGSGGDVDPLVAAPGVVVIEVADSGPGIPEEDLERVFDPFFTTKPPGEGTGLGLAICAQLVESMGGRIEVRSRSEGGAAFTLRLPGSGGTFGPGAPA